MERTAENPGLDGLMEGSKLESIAIDLNQCAWLTSHADGATTGKNSLGMTQVGSKPAPERPDQKMKACCDGKKDDLEHSAGRGCCPSGIKPHGVLA